MKAQAHTRRPSPLSRFAERFIQTYKLRVSQRMNAACRFEPCCSSYGLEAFRKYGFLKAAAKTSWRLLRCNRWNKGPAFDPP